VHRPGFEAYSSRPFLEQAMLTFIISMRARALSQDWGYHTWLLERTLDSILAQTNPEFDVVVVCHDIPEIPQAKHAAVHMLKVDFPLPRRENSDMTVDKVLKISRGVEWAIARGSDYVMYVDADDLVSRHLSEFVATHPKETAGISIRGTSTATGTAGYANTRRITLSAARARSCARTCCTLPK